MSNPRQIAIGEAAPLTWAALRYAGNHPLDPITTFLQPHPRTGRNCTITYDRRTGATTSAPPCPELESFARFATLVEAAWHDLHLCRFNPRQLAGLLDAQRAIVATRPGDEQARAQLAAVEREARKIDALGPAIAEARAAGGDIRRGIAAELFGEDSRFSAGGC